MKFEFKCLFSKYNRIITVSNLVKRYGWVSQRYKESIDDTLTFIYQPNDDFFFRIDESSFYVKVSLGFFANQNTYIVTVNRFREEIISSIKSTPGGNGYGESHHIEVGELVVQLETTLKNAKNDHTLETKIIKSFLNAFDDYMPWFSCLEFNKRKLSKEAFDDYLLDKMILLSSGKMRISVFSKDEPLEKYIEILLRSNHIKCLRMESELILGFAMGFEIDTNTGLLFLTFKEIQKELRSA